MIRSIVCLVAEGVIRDAETNHISIFNILEGITAEGFPVVVQRLTFFTLLERGENDTQKISTRFEVHIDGKELYGQEVNIDLPGQTKE